MREIAVASGKGGTGKTSLVAAFAALARPLVLADCDVDAADLYLITEPQTIRQEEFTGRGKAEIDPVLCRSCGKCREVCRFDAVRFDGPGNAEFPATFRVDSTACEGCGVCVYFCPNEAIGFRPEVAGAWFLSETRFGPMSHAQLTPGAENSGRLVTLVRENAKKIAEEKNADLILIDGAPGIGCPVIASIIGVDLVLIVTEPTVAGIHDLHRIAELIRHFGMASAILINRCDIHEGQARAIEESAREMSIPVIGRIPYDPDFSRAQLECLSLVEYANGPTSEMIARAWSNLNEMSALKPV